MLHFIFGTRSLTLSLIQCYSINQKETVQNHLAKVIEAKEDVNNNGEPPEIFPFDSENEDVYASAEKSLYDMDILSSGATHVKGEKRVTLISSKLASEEADIHEAIAQDRRVQSVCGTSGFLTVMMGMSIILAPHTKRHVGGAAVLELKLALSLWVGFVKMV